MSPFLWFQVNAKIINLATNNLNSDPVSQRIYASVRGVPGTITPIDPATGTTGAAIPVGNGPTGLARSDNGQFLYMGLDSEAAVQRVNLATQMA
jgi:DNA-binding beta-propeller fold protein YncE